ncbi:MAG TPA: hypothetical protein VM753_09580 [Anaeromyxobacter sp.]|jgi:hypothetical protein|nr:hypothetical protein [Anaeromyxobacter sp.]
MIAAARGFWTANLPGARVTLVTLLAALLVAATLAAAAAMDRRWAQVPVPVRTRRARRRR